MLRRLLRLIGLLPPPMPTDLDTATAGDLILAQHRRNAVWRQTLINKLQGATPEEARSWDDRVGKQLCDLMMPDVLARWPELVEAALVAASRTANRSYLPTLIFLSEREPGSPNSQRIKPHARAALARLAADCFTDPLELNSLLEAVYVAPIPGETGHQITLYTENLAPYVYGANPSARALTGVWQLVPGATPANCPAPSERGLVTLRALIGWDSRTFPDMSKSAIEFAGRMLLVELLPRIEQVADGPAFNEVQAEARDTAVAVRAMLAPELERARQRKTLLRSSGDPVASDELLRSPGPDAVDADRLLRPNE